MVGCWVLRAALTMSRVWGAASTPGSGAAPGADEAVAGEAMREDEKVRVNRIVRKMCDDDAAAVG